MFRRVKTNLIYFPALYLYMISELIGKSVPAAKRYLNSLVKSIQIEFKRAQKNRGYFIIKH